MKCPNCGGENITFIPNTQTKTRGCVSWVLAMVISLITFGIGLIYFIYLLVTNKKTITTTRAICGKCGHQWDA